MKTKMLNLMKWNFLFMFVVLAFCLNKSSVSAKGTPELSIQIGETAKGDTYTFEEIKKKVDTQTSNKEFALKQKYTYSMKAVAPDLLVKYREDNTSTALPTDIPKDDYTITYSNNINAGTAKIVVTFKTTSTNYSKWKECTGFVDSQTFTFEIEPKSVESSDITYKIIKNPSYVGVKKELTAENIQVYDGTTLLKKGYDYSVGYYLNNLNVGTASATIVGNDAQRIKENPTKTFSGNYTGKLNFTYQIEQKNISDTDVEVTTVARRYTGSPLTTTVTIKIGTFVLQNDVDYTISYSDNTYVGLADITITGKGSFKGTQTANFTIVPVPTTLTKVVRAGSKKLRATWKSVPAQRSGYQLIVSTKSSFTGSTTKRVFVSYKNLSKTMTKLKKNKKYYVKVRVYKTVDGVKYYSAWSNIRTIKVK